MQASTCRECVSVCVSASVSVSVSVCRGSDGIKCKHSLSWYRAWESKLISHMPMPIDFAQAKSNASTHAPGTKCRGIGIDFAPAKSNARHTFLVQRVGIGIDLAGAKSNARHTFLVQSAGIGIDFAPAHAHAVAIDERYDFVHEVRRRAGGERGEGREREKGRERASV
eukprot:1297122-Rhodomonas_salina.1